MAKCLSDKFTKTNACLSYLLMKPAHSYINKKNVPHKSGTLGGDEGWLIILRTLHLVILQKQGLP